MLSAAEQIILDATLFLGEEAFFPEFVVENDNAIFDIPDGKCSVDVDLLLDWPAPMFFEALSAGYSPLHYTDVPVELYADPGGILFARLENHVADLDLGVAIELYEPLAQRLNPGQSCVPVLIAVKAGVYRAFPLM